MNFLMRSTTHVYSDREKPSTIPEPRADALPPPLPIPHPIQGSHSLESLMSDDPYAQYSTVEQFEGEIEGENGSSQDSKNDAAVLTKHLDVSEEEGWIAIPYSMSYTLTNPTYLFILVLCYLSSVW